jgi:hypothetical protein
MNRPLRTAAILTLSFTFIALWIAFDDRRRAANLRLAALALAFVACGDLFVAAELEVREGFGWGLVLAARGAGLRWLPVELG